MSEANLSEIKRRAHAVKVANLLVNPWQLVSGDGAGRNWFVAALGQGRDGNCYYIETDHVHASERVGDAKRDGELIIKLREMVPALVADIETMAAELESLRRERAAEVRA